MKIIIIKTVLQNTQIVGAPIVPVHQGRDDRLILKGRVSEGLPLRLLHLRPPPPLQPVQLQPLRVEPRAALFQGGAPLVQRLLELPQFPVGVVGVALLLLFVALVLLVPIEIVCENLLQQFESV